MADKQSNILDLVHEPYEIDPDHILHQKSQLVSPEEFDKVVYDYRGLKVASNVKDLAEKMLMTMRYHNGLGLAAVQVGVQKKIIVVDMGYLEKNGDSWPKGKEEIMINAEIEKSSNELKEHKEGCLSFGYIFPKIIRPKEVLVSYLDVNNKPKNFEGSDSLLIACIQHEIDHTNGIVFTDKIGKFNERERQLKKYRKWREKTLQSGNN
jgi:peptide deformylase